MDYDFSGYATRYNVRCSDGRTITPTAFKEQDGKTIPLVYSHSHDDPSNVLGHALLEAREDGMYAYARFNGTPNGQAAKLAVEHGDIKSLSIYANNLVEKNKDVIHGNIRELSLVLAGANPGAVIDNVMVQHGDGSIEPLGDEATIFVGEENADMQIAHADGEDAPEGDETLQDILATLNDKQKSAVSELVMQAFEEAKMAHSDEDSDTEEDSDEDSDTDEDSDEDSEDSDEDAGVEHSDSDTNNMQHNEEGSSMAKSMNIFEGDASNKQGVTLSHDDMKGIFEDAKRTLSLKEAVESYALKHGIENIDILFPDAQAVTNTPDFIKRRSEWVADVISSTRHTPFSRIKSMTADLTLDEARAKGYIKGHMKREEFFSVAKRVTTPQTIYKKQKLDRDDIIDITEFDVVVWLKEEMRVMLDEEIARAILIGDGRSNADDDKIKEENIRPVATDSELYVTTVYVNIDDANSSAEEIIDALTLHRRHYRGSGNPTFYTSESVLARLLLAKDDIGRRHYSTVNDLSAAIRCQKVMAVEVMENQGDLVGILVNLADYTVGSNRGGQISLFDDFDIDYNQYKYLIETRISGALTKPKSAIVIRKVSSTMVLVTATAPTFDAATGVVTIPTDTGVIYRNRATGSVLAAGSTIDMAPGDTMTIEAVPAAGYYFSSNADDDWFYRATV